MPLKLMGKKKGMMQRFDGDGNMVACTVIEIEANVVTEIRNEQRDGYTALQVGAMKVQAKDERQVERKIGKPQAGNFKKKGIEAQKRLTEFRLEDVAPYEVGNSFDVAHFEKVPFVDICSTSKGKGYQGVMKLHNFSGIGRSHGAGPVHRHAGSTGMRSTPGRCLPNGKRASRMGGRKTTVQNLQVLHVDTEKSVLLVKGAVPGAVGSLVYVSSATKKAPAA